MIEWFEKAIDFSNILNISITASWLILVVIGLRLLLKKAPKWVNVALWGIVALRLLMPFSIESSLSLVPSVETVSDQLLQAEPAYSHGQAQLDIITNPNYGSEVTMDLDDSMDSFQWSMVKMSLVWYAGIAAMSLYTLISFFILRRKLRTAIILRDNLYQCETVSSPFVLGILKPKIYLPYGMDDQNFSHVIAHELAHICRKDHWWKPLGFLLLSIHWFNPLMWIAYILLCRDIELACDEKVIAELGNEQRADYTQALVACAVNRRMIAACPLAFGEVGVKDRVRSIMNYRKPTFWIILLAVIVCVIVAVCFLTNPVAEDAQHSWNKCYLRETEQTVVRKAYNRDTQPIPVTIKFESTSGPLEIELIYSLKVNGGEDWQYSNPIKLSLGESTEFTVPADNHFCVSVTPVSGQNGYVTFRFTEGIGGSGDPRKVIAWFDYTDDPSEMSYEEELKIQIDEFPNITFKYNPYEIIATTSWDDRNTVGNTILISGMPIWNAHFCDLTGDGKPEICSQVSYGSGIIDSRVIIFDYANGVSYKLEDRGYHDYYLRFDGANLYVDKRVYRSDEVVSSGRLVFKDGRIQIEGVDTAPTNILQAKVQEIRDGYFLVEPVEGSWERNSASQIEVPMKNMEPSPEPEVGDILEIEYDGQLAETYPARISTVYGIRVAQDAEILDLIPMVMVNGTLYLDTGYESATEARCGVMDGEIISQVDGSKQPSIDDQSNFGTGYGYQYGAIEGTIEIYMNGKWWIFATEEARKEIQFPTTEDMNRFYLTIGADGVKSIELSMPQSSGGCENADGSLFKKGEHIWLENLDGYGDLRGLTITALDENGAIIWTASIPDTEENRGFTHLVNNDWEITNIQ